MNSLVYAANNVSQAFVAAGTVINFGTPVRRYGCNCSVSGGNLVTHGSGYYYIDTNISFTAGGQGTATVQLYKDGVAIPGAIATLTTASATAYSVSIPAVVRDKCCCDSTITAVISGVNGNVTSVAIVGAKT